MYVLRHNFGITFGIGSEVFRRFRYQVLKIDALTLACLKSLLSQLVRLLSILVNRAERFLVLLLVLERALLD